MILNIFIFFEKKCKNDFEKCNLYLIKKIILLKNFNLELVQKKINLKFLFMLACTCMQINNRLGLFISGFKNNWK